MGRSERFGLVLSSAEKLALQRLAEQERIPAAAVIRRLIWREAERMGVVDGQHSKTQAEVKCDG